MRTQTSPLPFSTPPTAASCDLATLPAGPAVANPPRMAALAQPTLVDCTGETVSSRRRTARRRPRRWPLPMGLALVPFDDLAVDPGIESVADEADLDELEPDDVTNPEHPLFSTAIPVAADRGASLIAEWDAASDQSAAVVARILGASEEATHAGSHLGGRRHADRERRRAFTWLLAGFCAGLATAALLLTT